MGLHPCRRDRPRLGPLKDSSISCYSSMSRQSKATASGPGDHILVGLVEDFWLLHIGCGLGSLGIEPLEHFEGLSEANDLCTLGRKLHKSARATGPTFGTL